MALDEEQIQQMFLLMLLAILFLFFLFESYFELNRPKFGHVSGLIVCVGIVCSFVVYLLAKASTIGPSIMLDL